MAESESIALIDLDGTVADFDKEMRRQLNVIANPREKSDPETLEGLSDDAFMEARRRLIKSQPGFWRNLPPIQEGLVVVEVLRDLGFQLMVLTKGPHQTTAAWTEKVEWAQKYIPGAGVCIVDGAEGCSGKGLVYGKVLFDDWPNYIEQWLKWRPRGLVIMTDQPWNRDFHHTNVFRFNPPEVAKLDHLQKLRAKLQGARDR